MIKIVVYCLLFVFWFITYSFNRENAIAQYRLSEYAFEPSKNRYQTALWSGMALFLVMSLRGANVGTDTQGYMSEYYAISNIVTSNSFVGFFKNEMGYTLIQFVFNRMGINWQLFLAFISAFVSYSISRFIYKYTANIFLGFFLYGTIGMFAMNMTGIRQSLAVAFVLLAFDFIKERKYIFYSFFIAVACSIHFTAIICIPLGVVTFLHYRRKSQLYIISLIPLVTRLATSFFGQALLRFSPRKYTISGYFDELNLQLNVKVEIVAFAILGACLVCLLLKDEIKDRDYHFFLLLSLYVSCIELSHALYMATRLGYYFIFFMTTMLANAIYRVDDKKIRYAGMMFMLLLPLIQFLITIPGASYGIDNYVFFWN